MNPDPEARPPKPIERFLRALVPSGGAPGARRPRAVVGVDADGASVRAVAVERRGRGTWHLVGVSSVESAPVAEALRPLASLAARAVAGLGPEESAVALFRPADVPDGDRAAAVRFVLEKAQQDFPADDAVAGESTSETAGDGEWTVVAGCGRAVAEAAVKPLVAAGARDVAVTPNALALEAVARLSGALRPGAAPVALAHLGRSRSLLAIARGESGVVFQRALRVGRQDLAHALAQTVSIDTGETVTLGDEETRELLRTYEIGRTEPVALADGRLLGAELVTGLLRPDLERLVLEIGKSLRHFERSPSRGDTPPPETLVISGEIAEIQGLDKYLERKLGLPVSVLNPLDGLALDLEAGSGVEAGRDRVALALAIGLAVDGAARVDLVPPSVRTDRVHRVVRRSVRVAASVAAAIVLALALRRGSQIGELSGRLDEARSLRATLTPHVAALARRDALRATVRRELFAREAACGRTARVAPLLAELRSHGSPAIFVESLDVEPAAERGAGGKLDVSLVALADGAGEALSAGERFVSALSASPRLAEVTTSADDAEVRRGASSGLRFRVTAAALRATTPEESGR